VSVRQFGKGWAGSNTHDVSAAYPSVVKFNVRLRWHVIHPLIVGAIVVGTELGVSLGKGVGVVDGAGEGSVNGSHDGEVVGILLANNEGDELGPGLGQIEGRVGI